MLLKTDFGIGDEVIYKDEFYTIIAIIVKLSARKVNYCYQLRDSLGKNIILGGKKKFNLLPVKI